MKYRRILLKLSGEALSGNKGEIFDMPTLDGFAEDIMDVYRAGVEIAIVSGGGNIFRGLTGTGLGVGRVQGDYMGMLATVINSMAIQHSLESKGAKATILSGIPVDKICTPMSRRLALQYLKEGNILLIAGGTGNPYFTTDSAAALRAVEIEADVLLKGTRVNGVYAADPEKDPSAARYERLTYSEAYEKNLKIMDLTAFTLCRENNMPLVVFDITGKGNLLRVVSGENVGTVVTP
jgi:uridylate kinase